MNTIKTTIMLLTTVFIFLNCTTYNKTTETRRPSWGDNPDTVVYLEQKRLGEKPVETYSSTGGEIKIIVYNDKFLSAMCMLSYFFENDSLSFMIYSCSNPDWDEKELNYKVHNNLSRLYGDPEEIKAGKNTFYHWTASDANIYYQFSRIHQGKIFWRTFTANIIYSRETIDKSRYLKDILFDSMQQPEF
jgi:hypothetical protein